MLRTLVHALLALVLVTAVALAAEKPYGKALSLKEATKISAILADPVPFHDKRVLVEGTIVDVCKKRGCWIKIAEEGAKAPIMFKVTDGVITFPVEAKGLRVKAEGVVFVQGTDAKGEKKTGEMCKGCGDVTVLLKGEGAVVFEAEPVQK